MKLCLEASQSFHSLSLFSVGMYFWANVDNNMSLYLSKCHNLIFKSDCTSHNIHIGEYELSEPDTEKDLVFSTHNINKFHLVWQLRTASVKKPEDFFSKSSEICQNRHHYHQN